MKCSRCPNDALPKTDGSSSGYCRECKRAYGKQHYQNNKDSYFKRARTSQRAIRDEVAGLKEVPCLDCGVRYPFYVMDFDHRPDEVKVDDVAVMVANHLSRQKILDEIAKCDVVCSNCHRERTHQRMLHSAELNLGLRS